MPPYKTPPSWPEDKSFERWFKEVQYWESISDQKPEALGPILALSLEGRKRDVAMEFELEELKRQDGLSKLLSKLKAAFDVNSVDKVFNAYLQFENFKRSENSSIFEYILDFDQLYTRVRTHKMVLPDAVLACKLLLGANLDLTMRQMVLASTTSLEYKLVSESLKRVFGDRPGTSQNRLELLKEEPAFVEHSGGTDEEESSALYAGRKTRFAYDKRGKAGRGRPYPVKNPTGRNPTDKFGKISTCNSCGSRNHWARSCPDNPRRDNTKQSKEQGSESDGQDQVFLTLASLPERLAEESGSKGILDTACTKTVAGERWVSQYIALLPSELAKQVKTRSSKSSIVFGTGKGLKALKVVTLPVKIGYLDCFIDVEVIPSELPLLISIKSMERAKFSISLERGSFTLGSDKRTFGFTRLSTGHIAIEVLPNTSFLENVHSVLLMSDDLDEKQIIKLHKQFGHCSASRLIDLVRKSGCKEQKVIKTISAISEKCDTCRQFGRSNPRPVVGLPLASDFNETVAIDLHQLTECGSSVYYLHIIDLFTRFSQAAIIFDKNTETIIEMLNRKWMFVFGAPTRVLCDNGGEFDSEKFRSNAENLNIEVLGTAAYSPWSNGCIERHNEVLTTTFLKVRSDIGPNSNNLCLEQAVFAKNCLSNQSGYSPYQLVYGRLPNLPNVLVNNPPALESRTYSEVVQTHLAALSSARTAFLQAEASERIKRALRHNVRNHTFEIQTGDKVYYKRKTNKWRGPGVVIGITGKTYVVKHGGQIVTVHTSSVRLSTEGLTVTEDQDESMLPLDQTKRTPVAADDDESEDEADREASVVADSLEQVVEGLDCEPEPSTNAPVSEQAVDRTMNVGGSLPSVKMHIRMHKTDQSEPCEAIVMSRAGKVGKKGRGLHKSWLNIEYTKPECLQGTIEAVDFERNVHHWEEVDSEDPESVLLLCTDDESSFFEAKQEELLCWKENCVYEEVPDRNQALITTRWIFTVKQDGRQKARLVARGFQDPDADFVVKDSPTVARDTFRLILSTYASSRQWTKCIALDVKTAFLQGLPLEREVFVRPPKEAGCENVVWKMKKCIYGLSDAARCWYDRVVMEFEKLGGKRSKFDFGLFLWSGETSGCICVHVDDFWAAGNDSFVTNVVQKLYTVFAIGTSKPLPHCYLGLDIRESDKGVVIDQTEFISRLQEAPLSKERRKESDSPLNLAEKSQLRSLVGKLLWPAVQTRPDVVYQVSSIVSNINTSCVRDLNSINKLIRGVKFSSDQNLLFPNLGIVEDAKIICFSDASFCNNSDKSTQGGYFVFISGSGNKTALISWKSCKLKRVVRSTLAAETLACIEAFDSASFYQNILSEVYGKILPIICFTDNCSLVEAVYSTKMVGEKRLTIDIAYLRQQMKNEKVAKICWIPTNLQLADCLTKERSSANANLLSVLSTNLLSLPECANYA